MPKTVSKYQPQTRTATTEAEYRAGGCLLLARAIRNAPHAVDPVDALQILFSRPDQILRPSTTRTYYAHVSAILSQLAEGGKISFERAATGRANIAELLKERRGKAQKRTSAKKNKQPSYEEYTALYEDILQKIQSRQKRDLTDKVLGLMFGVAPYVGLRPVEWLTAKVVNSSLVVANAKTTNGRAPGVERRIDLSGAPPAVLSVARRLIAGMQKLSPSQAHWRRLLKVLDERLARDCARLKISRWSISIFRQIAQASWKKAGFSEAVIAALAGHISTRTSRNHYAGGRHGWNADFAVASPDPGLVAQICLHNRILVPSEDCRPLSEELHSTVDSAEEDGVSIAVSFHP